MKPFLLFVLAASMLCSCHSKAPSSTVEPQSPPVPVVETPKKHVITITQDEFLEKVANYKTSPNQWKYLGDKPSIVDFYADWCAPCRRLSPILEELAAEFAGQIVVYKIDVDQNPQISQDFQIESIPTLIFSPVVGNPQRVQGLRSKEELREAIKDILL